jgi:hypothetical protein
MEVDCDEFGINPGDYLDYLALGCGAEMASQQKLGLWTKRRPRAGSGDHPDSPLVGENLNKPLLSPEGGTGHRNQPDGSRSSLEFKL